MLEKYRTYFEKLSEVEKHNQLIGRFNKAYDVFSRQVDKQKIQMLLPRLKEIELQLKNGLNEYIHNPLYAHLLDKEHLELIRAFLSSSAKYFEVKTFNQDEFDKLGEMLNYFAALNANTEFIYRKRVTGYQANILHTPQSKLPQKQPTETPTV